MQARSTPHRAARDVARTGTLVLVLLGLLASAAWGYRPFVSTDAAVVECARMEIELGYLTLVRTQGENTFMIPEVNGESVHGQAASNSGLLGVLWQPRWLKAVVDAGIRRGFSRGAPDWLFTTGLTFSFPLVSQERTTSR